jgi:hypothetical protein
LGAFAGIIEEAFSRVRIAGEQLGQRIITRHFGAVERGLGLVMQESDDAEHLIVFHGGESGHTFIGAAGAHERREQVAVSIMTHNAGPHQIGCARPRGIIAVAESATRLEIGAPTLYNLRVTCGFCWSGRLLLSGPGAEREAERENQKTGSRSHRHGQAAGVLDVSNSVVMIVTKPVVS